MAWHHAGRLSRTRLALQVSASARSCGAPPQEVLATPSSPVPAARGGGAAGTSCDEASQLRGVTCKSARGFAASARWHLLSLKPPLPLMHHFSRLLAFLAFAATAAAQTFTLPSGPAYPRQNAPSSRHSPLTISEIMYNPPAPEGDELEFVEIYNSEPVAWDISGYSLSGEIAFTFQSGTTVPAGGRLVVAFNPALVQTKYGISGVKGPWTGHLDNKGGTLRLENRIGAVLLEVSYSDDAPWPIAVDGDGSSLVLARPDFGENDVRAWAASAGNHGHPGSHDPTLTNAVLNVRINEILARPAAGDGFVELYNYSAANVDVSGCRVTDGVAIYAIDGGENVELSQPDGANFVVVNAVRYGDADDWGKWSDGNGSSLELRDAHSDNALAQNWAGSDETAKAAWTNLEVTGVVSDALASPTDRLYAWLLDAGEMLLDDVEVHIGAGANIVTNPSLDANETGWLKFGTHTFTTRDATGGVGNTGCYHLRAQAGGKIVGDKLSAALSSTVSNGQTVTLRAKARWLAGSPRIVLPLKGTGVELAGALTLPANPGTPGAANSRALR